jgi:hypothetical protein
MPWGNLVEASLRGLRHTSRSLLKRPAFAATIVLTLGLGLGSTVATFSRAQLRRTSACMTRRRMTALGRTTSNGSGSWKQLLTSRMVRMPVIQRIAD